MRASRSRAGVARAAGATRAFLSAIGRDPRREAELRGTPERVAALWIDRLVDGYDKDPAAIVAEATLPARATRSVVVVRDLTFHSMCPHHLMPFFGTAHVAYVPSGRVVGFSALGRLLDCFAHRLTIQETIAQEVADALTRHLGARAASCALRAKQLCLITGGPARARTETITVAWSGRIGGRSAERQAMLRALTFE